MPGLTHLYVEFDHSVSIHNPQHGSPSPSRDLWIFVRNRLVRYGGSTVIHYYNYLAVWQLSALDFFNKILADRTGSSLE